MRRARCAICGRPATRMDGTCSPNCREIADLRQEVTEMRKHHKRWLRKARKIVAAINTRHPWPADELVVDIIRVSGEEPKNGS